MPESEPFAKSRFFQHLSPNAVLMLIATAPRTTASSDDVFACALARRGVVAPDLQAVCCVLELEPVLAMTVRSALLPPARARPRPSSESIPGRDAVPHRDGCPRRPQSTQNWRVRCKRASLADAGSSVRGRTRRGVVQSTEFRSVRLKRRARRSVWRDRSTAAKPLQSTLQAPR